MDQVCPVCQQQQKSWSHICQGPRDVVHFERFRDFPQNSNPLDRLSFSEYLEIMQSDVGRWSLKLFQSWWLEDEVCTS